jgi:hypothetical protein
MFPGGCPDRRFVVSLPDLPWKLFRGTTESGINSWTLAEVILGDAHGYELPVGESPTPQELSQAMIRLCGRPIADALVSEARRRMSTHLACPDEGALS